MTVRHIKFSVTYAKCVAYFYYWYYMRKERNMVEDGDLKGKYIDQNVEINCGIGRIMYL